MAAPMFGSLSNVPDQYRTAYERAMQDMREKPQKCYPDSQLAMIRRQEQAMQSQYMREMLDKQASLHLQYDQAFGSPKPNRKVLLLLPKKGS